MNEIDLGGHHARIFRLTVRPGGWLNLCPLSGRVSGAIITPVLSQYRLLFVRALERDNLRVIARFLGLSSERFQLAAADLHASRAATRNHPLG